MTKQSLSIEAAPSRLEQFEAIARERGTPVFIVDHDKIRQNYTEFKESLPRVQAYYAVKANPDPAIVKTLYEMSSSFDVASLPEFMVVYENIKGLSESQRQDFIWDKIIYANTIKRAEALEKLDQYKPLVTYDNADELKKIKKYCPHAGLVLRIKVPNTGSMVELSSKFGISPGEAVDLIIESFDLGLEVEGISFHVGSQCNNFENYIQALQLSWSVLKEAASRGRKISILDIGGGFPVKYNNKSKSFKALAKKLNVEIDRLFPADMQILAEPGRFMVANAAVLVAGIIGKATRDGKTCYYLDDGVYHTFSGIVFDHCQYRLKSFKDGEKTVCSVFGPTCDAFDTISVAEELPDLELGDLLYAENIGAYSIASSTYFNGFPPAETVHINL